MARVAGFVVASLPNEKRSTFYLFALDPIESNPMLLKDNPSGIAVVEERADVEVVA